MGGTGGLRRRQRPRVGRAGLSRTQGSLLAEVGGRHTVWGRQRPLRVRRRQVPVTVLQVGGLGRREVVGREIARRDAGDDRGAGAGGGREVGGAGMVRRG